MLEKLQGAKGARRPRKRIGRGMGRHKGAGRGTKGQGKRAKVPLQFEGGQMPLTRRIPKRGFTNIHRQEYEVLNLRDLHVFGEGASVGPEELAARGLVRGKAKGAKIKLLAAGEAPRGCKLRVHKISAAARAKLEAAGGGAELVQ